MGKQTIEVRRFTPDDAGATLRCFQRAVRGTASHDYDARQVEAWAAVDADAWEHRRESAETWVAEHDGQLVGFGDVDDEGYIDMMFVDPDAGRIGVASAIFEHLLALATLRGLAELTVHASITARPFFESHGFVIAAEQRIDLRGSMLTNYRMHLAL